MILGRALKPCLGMSIDYLQAVLSLMSLDQWMLDVSLPGMYGQKSDSAYSVLLHQTFAM